MSRINPIYTAVLLMLVLILVSFSLSSAKSELKEVKDNYKTTLKLSEDLNALKETYADKIKVKKSLQKILNQSSLRSSKIIQNLKKSSVTINSEGMDINALNLLMGKLLNNSYNIKSLSIYRLSDTHVSLKMEIKW